MSRLREQTNDHPGSHIEGGFQESPREQALREQVEILTRELAEARRAKSEIRRSLDETLDVRYLAEDILTSSDGATAAKKLIELSSRIIPFDWAAVFLYNEELNDFVPVNTDGAPENLDKIVQFQTHQGIIDWVIGEATPIVIPGPLSGEKNGGGEDEHLVIVPLIAGDRGIGVLEAHGSGPRSEYSSHQLQLASILASQAAVVIDNTRLRETMAAKIREMSSISEIGETIASALALEDLLGLIVGEAIENTHSQFGCVHLVARDNGELVASVARRNADGRLIDDSPDAETTSIATWVMKAKHTIMVPDIAADPRFRGRLSNRVEFNVALSSPMVENDDVVGVITLRKDASGGRFADSDSGLLDSFARQAAVALRMSRLQKKQAETERRLKASQAELLRASKLAAVGLLAGGVAHEINNPLQVILGFTQLLLRKTENLPEWEVDLKTIEKQTVRVAEIVSQLLNSCRRLGKEDHIQETEEIDVNALLREATRLVSHQLELNEIELLLNLDPGSPKALGNSGEIEQVFLNMMTNANHAMPDKGRLEISTRSSDSHVEVVFADTGTGIPPEKLQSIFDPFYTTKPAGKGTGLGLFVCHSIIEKHGGSIAVESTEGQGTTFRIRLPQIGNETNPAPEASPTTREGD